MSDKDKKETTAVAAVNTNAALEQLPAFMKRGDTRGTEAITKDDIQLPRLALAQALSPQLVEGDPKFIEGLTQGMLFNSLTSRNYGKGPIEFIVVRADAPRYIEFHPRDQGGGIKDMNVPPDDPRTRFTMNDKGETVNPVATKFYDFVVVLVNRDNIAESEVISLSFKSSGLKVAREINSYIKLGNIPIFGRRFMLTTASEKNSKGTYYVYKVKNAGVVQDETVYRFCEQAFEGLRDKKINIDREEGTDDFPYGANEGGDAPAHADM